MERRDQPAETVPDPPPSDETAPKPTLITEASRETRHREAAPPLGIRTFQALAYRDFRYLWLGRIAQAFSQWMEQIARAWLVLSIVGDPALQAVHLGLIMTARMVPQFGMGLVAGVLSDWYNRRTIMLLAKTGAAGADFVLAVLVLSGRVELWHVYAITVIKGMFMALDQPARQSLIPSLVPPGQVTNAVALNSATMNTMRILGAATAGLLLAAVGIGWTLMAVSLGFLCAAYFTLRLRVPPQAVVRQKKSIRSAVSSFMEGLRFAWANPSIRWIVILAMVFLAFGRPYTQVFVPLFAKQVLDIGETGLGFLVATTGAGALVGALALATVNPSRNRGMILIVVMATFGAMLTLFSLSTYLPWLALSFGLIALVGMVQTPQGTLANAVLLDSAPSEMRGRVIALFSLDRSVTMLGGTIAGLLAAALGPQIAQVIFGAACVLGGLSLAFLAPAMRKVQ